MGNQVLSFEVMGQDAPALRGFYEQVFGWTCSQAAAFDYWVVDTGGRGVLGGIGPVQAAGQPGSAGFATFKVEVEDPAAVLAAAERLGGRTLMAVREIPGTGMQIAYLADPEGHVVGLSKGLPGRPDR
ncbi:MAG: VOC family protein [bacterium]|jgi:predicted enzyme related to lactoylglutathione lyase|nr:VOC family protein [bacterium]